MTRNGGSLADPGSVVYLFHRKGVVIVPSAQDPRTVSEDDVLEATLDAGAEEVNDLGESSSLSGRLAWSRCAPPGRGRRLRLGRGVVRAVDERRLGKDGAGKVFRLIEALEDLDDVQNVFGNFDVSDEVMESLDA